MSDDVVLIEWLDNLDQLKKREFFLMSPLYKVKIMDSSWCRTIAIEDKD